MQPSKVPQLDATLVDRRRWLTDQLRSVSAISSGWLSTSLSSACSPLNFGGIAAGLLATQTGCFGSGSAPDNAQIIGRIGIGPGRFQKPRAIAIDSQDRLFVVDMTGRIQVLSNTGAPLAQWRTPYIYQGKPTGLTISPEGNLWVADTHYYRILEYQPDGTPLLDRTFGGVQGTGPGEFGLVTDIVIDSKGCRYIAEYGEFDRIQKFSPDGEFLMQWGGHGDEPGKFLRPQSIAIDEQDLLWVADACNHRIQVFDTSSGEARLERSWGSEGTALGQLRYPYGLLLTSDQTVVIAEFGNHRVQRLTREGQSIESWGKPGRGAGELDQPWGVARDSLGNYFVLDSYNHRIQRFRFESDPA